MDEPQPEPQPKPRPEEYWGTGYLYLDPDYVPGTHPIEKGEVTWHHVWPKRKPG